MPEVPRSKGRIETAVTYLEMRSPPPPALIVPDVAAEVTVERADRPEIGFYRFLYDAVGRDYNWTARKLMTDGELKAVIHDPGVEVDVLKVGGETAGFVEFDSRTPPDVEISMFGIVPAFHGRKLGPYFLDWAIRRAWSAKRPRRLWLHTCALDHPKALATYLKGGFAKFDEKREFVDLI